jgi:molybdate transport system substrate-binding protein
MRKKYLQPTDHNFISTILSKRRIAGVLLFLILGGVLLSGCSKKGKTELLIGAAASLESAMKEIQPLFEKQYPDIQLSFTFASSGTIEQQIREGAPVDVFLSAAKKQIVSLIKDELLLPDSGVDLYRNEVVLIVPADSNLEIADFMDITKADIIAIGDPESVPTGQYAKVIFERLGIWEAVYRKATLGKAVTEVAAWVSSGDAQVGVVYKTDATQNIKLKIVASAPEGEGSIAIYPGAIVKNTKSEAQAKEFLAYLDTKEAEEIMVKYGFTIID